MGFNDIEPFRKALQGIPEGLIKPSMASLLWVIVSYPNGCFLGQDALAKQACLKHENFNKVLRQCTKLGLIEREQRYARKGLQQCYRVNMTRLLELGRVELSTPITPERVETETAKGGTESPNGGTPVIPYKDNKYNKSSEKDYFNNLLSFVPGSKRFDIGKELRKVLADLEQRGTTSKAIEDHIGEVAWDLIDSPEHFVMKRLRDLLARPVRYSAENPPPKCNNLECDPGTRLLSSPVDIPNGNGAKTFQCLECNPFQVNKRNGF